MKRIALLAACALVAFTATGCTIVKDLPADQAAIPADAAGDDSRTATRIAETFDSKLLPYVREKAIDLVALRAALAGGLDTAGAAHANRGSGEGAAWNFPVKGEGRIVAAKLETRARTIDVDVDADGKSDATVQLGPVIKGSTLRDVAPFYNFDDFRDQIEFAKLARALNDRIAGLISVPEGDLFGKAVSFVGVVPLKSATEAIVVTPIEVNVTP